MVVWPERNQIKIQQRMGCHKVLCMFDEIFSVRVRHKNGSEQLLYGAKDVRINLPWTMAAISIRCNRIPRKEEKHDFVLEVFVVLLCLKKKTMTF